MLVVYGQIVLFGSWGDINVHFVQLQEGDEDQYGEVRDEGSDDSEGEEADESSTLTANVSHMSHVFLYMSS